MANEMTPAEIRTASAIIGIALERFGAVSEDRADELMGEMMQAYEPGMTADELLAAI